MSEQATKLGQLPPPGARRDAIHVAVVPVVASQRLAPGTPVGLNALREAVMGPREECIGVVDPFLTHPVEQGEWVWLCLRPGTVSNLRHAWAHPAFPMPVDEAQLASEREVSKAWLEGWAKAYWPDDPPENILAYLKQAIGKGQICFGVDDYYTALEDSKDEGTRTLSEGFWHHYERYTGQTRPKGALQFRCAC